MHYGTGSPIEYAPAFMLKLYNCAHIAQKSNHIFDFNMFSL